MRQPSPPLVATPPESARWKIVLTPKKTSGASEGETVKEREYIKTPSAAVAYTRWSDGKTTEAWIAGNHYLTSVPDNPGIYVTPLRLRPVAFHSGAVDFVTRFPGFAWLDLKHYVGTVAVGSQRSFHYADKSTGNEAWVAVETNLPVAYSDTNCRYAYEFFPPPRETPQMPEKFLRELRNNEKAEAQ